MIFRRISYRIAIQFTSFVFLLLLFNGLVFLVVDFNNQRMQTHYRLARTLQLVLDSVDGDVTDIPAVLPPVMRERVRITNAAGETVFSGAFFADIPFKKQPGFAAVHFQNEQYTILTAAFQAKGKIRGYIQMADVERFQMHDLPQRALLYFIVSGIISALTFAVGLFFARRSLKPAEEMVLRLEQFTQDASHELRTPLAALNSSLDLALKSKKFEEGIISAKEDVKQISTLVERLLELARIDTFALEKVTVDLSDLLSETVERHRALAEEKNIVLKTEIEKNISVKADAALLRQVIINLLSNAIKFNAPDQGQIEVKLDAKSLSIKNAGAGIPALDLPHIFDRFYQADASRARGGYGLGLSLVKRIIDLHAWTVGVQSTAHKSTVFTIRFPREQASHKSS